MLKIHYLESLPYIDALKGLGGKDVNMHRLPKYHKNIRETDNKQTGGFEVDGFTLSKESLETIKQNLAECKKSTIGKSGREL